MESIALSPISFLLVVSSNIFQVNQVVNYGYPALVDCNESPVRILSYQVTTEYQPPFQVIYLFGSLLTVSTFFQEG